MPKTPLPTEYDEQVALITWADTHPDDRLRLLYSHLNGMRTYRSIAIKAKRSGARKGIPDLFLPVPTLRYGGMYIEMKRKKGGVVSPEQKDWIAKLRKNGYHCVVCRGADDAIERILEYLGSC